MNKKSYFQGIVVFYDKTIYDEPEILYFYKTVNVNKYMNITLKSFSHYLYSIKWSSFKENAKSNELNKAFAKVIIEHNTKCTYATNGNEVHIFYSTVAPSKSKLDSVPSIQDRKKYKDLEASEDFKNRASSNEYPVFVKNFNCNSDAVVFNHVEMTKIYKEYCSEIKVLFEEPIYDILKYYMHNNIPLKQNTFYLFPEPIRYDSGVSIERDYLDEYSVYIGKRFIPAKANLISSLYRSLRDDNPEHYVRAILEESFTQFILFVQEKRLDLKDLNKDMLVACAAYVFKNYTYDKLFEKCTADMDTKAKAYFDSAADNLVKEFKEDPAKVYKEYVQIYNSNRTVYPMYAVRKAPGVIDVYKWKKDAIAAYKKANNITPKRKAKTRALSQKKVLEQNKKIREVRELKENGMNISQIHKKLQESTDKTFHMSINTVRKIFKSL